MIGAIIGDIVGSRFEFNNTDDLNFELFTDECSFTDDSICTLAIAYALVSGISYEESLKYRKLSRMQHLDFCQTSWQAISQSFTNHWHKDKNNKTCSQSLR